MTKTQYKEPEFIELFEVLEHVDKEFGMEGVNPIGYFRSRFVAQEHAKTTGVGGRPGPIRTVTVLSLDGGETGYVVDPGANVVIHQETDDEIRKMVMAKLSDQERKVLGVE